LYGNVAVVVDKTMPRPVAQLVIQAVDRLQGAVRFS